MAIALEDDADFVIVGTGAGGATAARVLTGAGRSVVLLEEGPALRSDERPERLAESMAQSMRGFGAVATAGMPPMPLLQGRLVGGSTAINSGIIWRMPADVREDWRRRHGLATLVDDAGLDATFERLEKELEVAPVEGGTRGGNAALMEAGARALGLPGKPITRNAARCRGAARCLQGCPGEARQSMDVSYVPLAVSAGARLHPLARVTRVRIAGGRATGVEGQVLDAHTRRPRGSLRVRARRAVVVACGAIETPLLLSRSGLRGMVGRRFQAHPGAAVVGRFPEPVSMAFGATQAYEVPMRDRGYKLESLSLPAEMLASRIPGVGGEWQERLAALDHYGQWCAQVRMRAMGTVRRGLTGAPVVHYEPLPEDLAAIKEAMALLCRMMFAAGATEVYPGIHGVPEVLTREADVDVLEQATLGRSAFHLVASHLFGTACAGADPARSVVRPTLESHAVERLFVMDGSVFPTNMGVNPQHSIMAVAWRGAERLAHENRKLLAAS